MRLGLAAYTVVVVVLVAAGIYLTWPVPVVWPSDDVGKMGVLLNYVYTLATVLMLFVVLGAGLFTMIQALDVAKSRKLTAISSLYNEYKTEAMRDAIRAVWTLSPQELRTDDGDKKRRLVSDYWNWVGWIVRERPVDTSLIFSRFQDNINVWERLAPIEEEVGSLPAGAEPATGGRGGRSGP